MIPVAESSKEAAARNLKSQAHLQCVACVETKPSYDMVKTLCAHHYCRSCINRLVQDSLDDESLFPLRYCRVSIPLSTMQDFLNQEEVKEFEEKTLEYNDTNRTYCANTQCLQYIHPASAAPCVRACFSCSTKTCITCKKQAHTGLCPEEKAEILKWQKRITGSAMGDVIWLSSKMTASTSRKYKSAGIPFFRHYQGFYVHGYVTFIDAAAGMNFATLAESSGSFANARYGKKTDS
ncbi:hypothetical protein BBP40_002490 [Aspergillus hancockii]|nr:hypothetical protein BBP40_002490 [Aspergillus hancockii]